MHTWHWRNWEGLPYLTCSILERWHHGFFTHQFWPRSPQVITEVLQPEASVYRLKQVHGNTVLTPQEVESFLSSAQEDFASADGLISEQPRQAVWGR
ncbi:hypothetical protein NSTCB13_01292 [Nostoc sp. DSM 114160]|jgi:copper oxidase (laccase) domain-containing protein